MGLFDANETFDRVKEKFEFESRYESIADKFKTMFDLPIPLLVEDHKINLEKDLIFTPEPVGLNSENILFYDLSKPINQIEFHTLVDLSFLWTEEGIILNNIDNICPENLHGAQRLITRILTEEDKSGKATFYGTPPIFLQFPAKNLDEKIDEAWNGPKESEQPRKTGRIKVALICKEFPEYLKDKNIFCSKIFMGN